MVVVVAMVARLGSIGSARIVIRVMRIEISIEISIVINISLSIARYYRQRA